MIISSDLRSQSLFRDSKRSTTYARAGSRIICVLQAINSGSKSLASIFPCIVISWNELHPRALSATKIGREISVTTSRATRRKLALYRSAGKTLEARVVSSTEQKTTRRKGSVDPRLTFHGFPMAPATIGKEERKGESGNHNNDSTIQRITTSADTRGEVTDYERLHNF